MKVLLILLLMTPIALYAQLPKIEPGVSQELAKWRAETYSDIRYKLDLTLEKMSPVLKGHMEIRVRVSESGSQRVGESSTGTQASSPAPAIILDWRKLPGHEKDSTISNVTLNGVPLASVDTVFDEEKNGTAIIDTPRYKEKNEHLIFDDRGVRPGENVITLDFTSPILTSGSAITRYIDKEDGSEYIYSLFDLLNASTAFPVFDQPDLKASFDTTITAPTDWRVISNVPGNLNIPVDDPKVKPSVWFPETKPINTYVFAFAAGPWQAFRDPNSPFDRINICPGCTETSTTAPQIYVRKSQGAKFQPHAAEMFRLMRETMKHLEASSDSNWPKYDVVLIPELSVDRIEHPGLAFVRESSVTVPLKDQKPNQ